MPNYYRIFIKKSGDQTLESAFFLPVNPDEIKSSVGSNNEDYNVLSLGPVIQPRTPKLKVVSFSSYFPGRPDSIMLQPESFKEPSFYISFFEKAFKNKEILTYIPSRCYETGEAYAATEDNGFQAVVTSWEYSEKGGETGDFYYSLELTEYKDFSPITIAITGETDTQTQAAIAVPEKTRDVPKNQLYVGATVTVNGPYYYSSYGDIPYYQSNGATYLISRIITDDPARPYPIHITTANGGAVGWVKKDSCQVVSRQ